MSVAALNVDMVKSLDRRFPLRDVPAYEKAVNFSGSYEQPIHRWFRYREGFSPSLMELIRQGDRVYDPFCGCGTALIEAARRQIEAVGTDVNPLAVFVAATKSRRYSSAEVTQFERLAADAITSDVGRAIPPAMPLLPKLFLPEVLDELLRIKAVIEQAAKPATRDLLHLAWISILEDCSNAFKEGNGLKYRYMRRAPGKYIEIPAKDWIPRYFGTDIKGFVVSRWLKATTAISEDINYRSKKWKSPRVVEASCLEKGTMSAIGKVDTAIFSPPYANRFDYFEAFKVELWMGGFVSDSGSLSTLRKRSMRNNLTVRTRAENSYEELEGYLSLMDETSTSVKMGIKDTLRGYFEDVQKLAENLKTCIRPGGRSICVVGNSAYAGVLVPTDAICASIFEKAGFRVEAIEIARHLTVSPQQRKIMSSSLIDKMRESVVICTRT